MEVAPTPVETPRHWSRVLSRTRAVLKDIYCLPPRIQEQVDAELQRADILSAWIGLAVASVLGLLYLLTPRALDSMLLSRLEPVPIVVGAFLLTALVRLRMAYVAPLSRAAQVVFVLTDFGLLYALIWTFHLQYHQPAAFYLKAPTFLFVFLLIAMRTLRFEPVGVIFAGLTAAAGWVGMAGYALVATPEPAVTRDFTDYLSAPVVLVGAEVEKVVAILLVTLVLALAIMAGRRALVMAVTGAAARDDLSRFFAPEVAERITSENHLLQPGFGEIRRGAVLVADIRGFTDLAARRPPREVIAVLLEYQKRVARVVGAHGGVIDKFLGDGVLATFGCASASGTPAADAVRALVELLEEAQGFLDASRAICGESLRIGFAVAGGQILCGTVGDSSRLEFTVIGDAVNYAAKLEKANKAAGTRALVDGSTMKAAHDEGLELSLIAEARRHRLSVEGAGEPQEVFAWSLAQIS